MNESRMNGMWVSFSCCCKHLPASTWHFINPSPSLHPTPPLSPHLPTPSSKRSHLFNVSLFRAAARILQMSGEIFLTRCDGAAIKGNGTSATKARTVIKRRRRKKRVPSENVWVMVRKRGRRWWLQGERKKNVPAMYQHYVWCMHAVHSSTVYIFLSLPYY